VHPDAANGTANPAAGKAVCLVSLVELGTYVMLF